MTPAPQPSVVRYLTAAFGAADGPTDADLLGRFAAGRDQAAFELLVWRHSGMVLRVSRAVLRDHHAAEDVTQATFLALARKAGSVGRRDAVAGWLYRVARRLAVRTATRRRPRPVADLAAVAGPDAGWDDGVVPIHDELARLPDKYRVPVLLCCVEGLSHADAARRLGWPVGSVAGRLARAKTLLHARLTRRGVAVPAVGVSGLLTSDALGTVPAAFADGTARAAVLFAAGATAVPDVSPFTLELAKGAIRAMTVTKLQCAASVLAACGALTASGMWATGQGPGIGPPGFGGAGAAAGLAPVAAPTGEKPAPPVRTADYAQRQRSLNNLKQLMLAIHNYEAANSKLPADVVDQAGKPLLSWRVELLPYLEQTTLYNEFKRDQPWDSEHNLRLLSKMPDLLRAGFEPKDATHTYYQRFKLVGVNGAGEGGGGLMRAGMAAGLGGPPGAGSGAPGFGGMPGMPPGRTAPGNGGRMTPGGPPGMMGSSPGMPGSPGEGGGRPLVTEPGFPRGFADITDGTSNTLCLAEVGPPVPWTKPADMVIDVTAAPPKAAGPFANVLNVAAYDGAVYSFRPDVDSAKLGAGPAILVHLIHPSDGAVTPPLSFFKARFAADTAEEKAVVARVTEENRKLVVEIVKLLEEQNALLAKPDPTAAVEQVEEQQQLFKRRLAELKAENDRLRQQTGSPVGPMNLVAAVTGTWELQQPGSEVTIFGADGVCRSRVRNANIPVGEDLIPSGTYTVTADGVVHIRTTDKGVVVEVTLILKDGRLHGGQGIDPKWVWKKVPAK